MNFRNRYRRNMTILVVKVLNNWIGIFLRNFVYYHPFETTERGFITIKKLNVRIVGKLYLLNCPILEI